MSGERGDNARQQEDEQARRTQRARHSLNQNRGIRPAVRVGYSNLTRKPGHHFVSATAAQRSTGVARATQIFKNRSQTPVVQGSSVIHYDINICMLNEIGTNRGRVAGVWLVGHKRCAGIATRAISECQKFWNINRNGGSRDKQGFDHI
jgi:hypothetical protein